MDFLSCLKKLPHKTLQLFHSYNRSDDDVSELIRDHLIQFPCLTNGVRSTYSLSVEQEAREGFGK